jgi:hypothetical protein
MDIEVQFTVTDDEAHLLPPDAQMPHALEGGSATLPAVGDVIFPSPRSAWTVRLRTWEQVSPGHLRVSLWLSHTTHMLDIRKPPTLKAVP